MKKLSLYEKVADMEIPLLSIVIPCKNEENYILNTLESLERQSYDMVDLQVIIADAGSTDNTIEIVQEYNTRSNMDICLVEGGYPPAGRNSGARVSKSKYILFMDADIEAGDYETIEKAVNLAEEKDLDLVSTFIKCKNGNVYDNIFWEHMHGFTYRYPRIVGPYAAGMFILIRRDRFNELGGFNERMILGDDWELTHRIQLNKFGVADTHIYTTNRRFKKSGYIKTVGQYFLIAMSRDYRKRGHQSYMHVEY